MPQRPRPHVLEDESRTALRAALPAHWIVRDVAHDYGVDLEVEVVTFSGKVTGRQFLVQIKATAAGDAAAIRLPADTCDYYRRLSRPVLLVLYRAATNDFRASWFHAVDRRLRKGQQTATFHLEEGERVFAHLQEELRTYYAWHRDELKLPVTFELQISEGGIFDLPASEIHTAIVAAAETARGLVAIGHPTFGAAISVNADRTVVRLGQVASVDFPTRGLGFSLRTLPADIFLGAGMALQKVGKSDLAGSLVLQFAPKSSLIGDASVAVDLGATLIDSHRVRDALELAERLEDSVAGGEWFLRLGLLARRESYSAADEEQLLRFLERRAARAERWGDESEICTANAELAAELELRGQTLPSLRRYRRALAAQADDIAAVWGIGRLLLSRGRYSAAVRWLAQAAALEADIADIWIDYADALLYDGQLSPARDVLAQRVRSEKGAAAIDDSRDDQDDPDDWTRSHAARLKLWFLESEILEPLPSERLLRQPVLAIRLVTHGSNIAVADVEECERMLRDALAADILCGAAWFHFAALNKERKDYRDALDEFVAAGLFLEHPADAWAEASVLALLCDELDLAVDAMGAGLLTRDRSFVDRLHRLIEEADETPETVQALREAVQTLERLASLMLVPGPWPEAEEANLGVEDVETEPAHEQLKPKWWPGLETHTLPGHALIVWDKGRKYSGTVRTVEWAERAGRVVIEAYGGPDAEVRFVGVEAVGDESIVGATFRGLQEADNDAGAPRFIIRCSRGDTLIELEVVARSYTVELG